MGTIAANICRTVKEDQLLLLDNKKPRQAMLTLLPDRYCLLCAGYTCSPKRICRSQKYIYSRLTCCSCSVNFYVRGMDSLTTI